MKNKKRGVALPSVIVLMSIVVAFSLLLITMVAGSNISTQYQIAKLEKQIAVSKMQADFVDNGSLDGEYTQTFEIIGNDQNTDQKALVVKKKSGSDTDLYFLLIYDFAQNKVLAIQTENFAISTKQIGETTYYYLADIIKYKEV